MRNNIKFACLTLVVLGGLSGLSTAQAAGRLPLKRDPETLRTELPKNTELDVGGSLLFTPYGGSIGPSLSARFGSGIVRGGFSANLGIFVGLAGGLLFSAQPELLIGPRLLSLHVAAMYAGVIADKGGLGTLIAVGGLESQVSDFVRIHADVYHPPLLGNHRDQARLWFPAIGARVLGPKKKAFVDVSMIFTTFDQLPVVPTLTVGAHF
ncbi:MAG: hypothetical protein V1798_02590 [Pseudomonadota bacterium]